MKKFLKGKSSKAGSEDADRNALFGNRPQTQRRPSSDSTASRETQLPAYQDPYATTSAAGQRQDPYLTKGGGLGSQPPTSKSSYANDPYATSSSVGQASTSSQRAPQLNSRQSTSTLAQREELFKGAQPDRRLHPDPYASRPVEEDAYGTGGQDGEGLQTQEEEDEDIEGIKQEIRFVKQESLSSTRNALRMANEAEEAGRSTLTKLGQQSESLANAERSLDLTKLANRDAQEKARELRHLNRSMFAIKGPSKPWGKAKRTEADELRVRQQFEDDRYERDLRESTRKESERRTDANLKAHAEALGRAPARHRMGLAERSKYQFDADEEDDEVEGEIDENLDQLAAVTSRLRTLAQATSSEVGKQNQTLQRLDEKGESVEAGIYMNTHRLKRIGG